METVKEIFNVFLSQIPDVHIFVLDPQGNYLAFSHYHQKIMEAHLRVRVQENMNYFDAMQDDSSKAQLLKGFELANQGESFSSVGFYQLDHDVLIQYQMHWDAFKLRGKHLGAICTITKITEADVEKQRMEKMTEYLSLFSNITNEALFYSRLEEPIDWDHAADRDATLLEVLQKEVIVFANEALYKQLGLKKEQIVGKTLAEFLDYPIANIKRDYEKILNDKDVELITLERKADGAFVWIEGQYYTVVDERGHISGHFGVRRDITSRVEDQQALEHSQRLMQHIIEHNTSAVAVFDRFMNYIYVSEQFKIDYNLQDQDVIGTNHYETSPNIPFELRQIHQRVLKGEIISNDHQTFVDAYGKVQHSRWECRPWRDVDDEIGGIILYAEIITKQKEQEQIIKDNQLLLRSMFSQAAIGIAYGPINNEFKQVNDTFCEIVNYEKEELSRLSFESLIYEGDFKAFKTAKTQLINHEVDSFKMEVRLMKLNHRMIWTNVTFSKVDYVGMTVPYIMIMIEDINERKQMEKEMYLLNYHDQLTGLYNRRFYEEELKRLNTPRNLPMSLIVIDADGLKLINDAFGHLSGDQMILEIAQAIQSECRADDVIARIGGDEFVVLLAKTSYESAATIAKRITKSLSSRTINHTPIAASIGIATKEHPDKLINDVFKEAEAKMYRQKLEHRAQRMMSSVRVILDAFFSEHADEKAHAERVSAQCYQMGKILHFENSQLEKLKMAALMHDIGKINIPADILNKVSELSHLEWDQIMRHSEIGYRILSAVNEFGEISEYVLAHHERWDGQGYPKGLKQDEIPLVSRIIAVVDAFDMMIHDQHYAKAMSVEAALIELEKQSGTQFDPFVVETFISNKVYEFKSDGID